MTTSTVPRAQFSDEQLIELLGLIADADSVELKLTVPDTNLSAAAVALDMDPLEGQVRQVFFFDTPDLRLNAAGVVARARRVQGRGDDSVVKLRPVEPDQLPKKLRKSPEFGVEVDAMPGGYVCSGSMKQRLEKPRVRKTVMSGGRLSSLFSKNQRAFFVKHAPDGLELDDLSILGPIFVLKTRITPKELGRRLVGEVWLYPDGSRIVELSTKCPPPEAFDVAAQMRAILASRGLEPAAVQETKTKKALEYFSALLQDGTPDRPPRATPPGRFGARAFRDDRGARIGARGGLQAGPAAHHLRRDRRAARDGDTPRRARAGHAASVGARARRPAQHLALDPAPGFDDARAERPSRLPARARGRHLRRSGASDGSEA